MADSAMPPSPSVSRSFLRSNDDDSGDNDVKAGMIIVAIVLLFLFGMILLRFGCNMLIDICILRDGESFMRTLSEIRRWFCPCWHPRTEPSLSTARARSSASSSVGRRNINSTNNDPTDGQEVVTMETVLSGLTTKQKQQIITSIVPHKTATLHDIETWRGRSGLTEKSDSQRNTDGLEMNQIQKKNIVDRILIEEDETSSIDEQSSDLQQQQDHPIDKDQQRQHQSTLICPICIHPIQSGDDVGYSDSCHHVFHQDCLSAWLSTHSKLCPYCRGEIVTQDMLNAAHQIRLSRQTTEEWNDYEDDNDDGEEEDDEDGDDDLSIGAFSRYRP